MYDGSLDFNFQGTNTTKTVSVIGGTTPNPPIVCSPYGTNQFYSYITPPNVNKKFELYYMVEVNGESELDPLNSNVGLYEGQKMSYFLYQPN